MNNAGYPAGIFQHGDFRRQGGMEMWRLGLYTLFFLTLQVATLPFTASASSPEQGTALWATYKQNFLQQDGRVIDTFQKDFSHSEAQAFGMMLAVKFRDRKTFDSILRWTRDNLQLRKNDRLLCWSWGKRPGGAWQIRDYNNASDGDILAAWALLKAARLWNQPAYHQEAMALIQDIRRLLLIPQGQRLVLLPGYSGFMHGENSMEYNPSYFIPAAFRDFASAGDDPSFWKKAIADGFAIQKKCMFGRFSMPADWVMLKGNNTEFSPKRSGRYGYDAVRVYLYTTQWLEAAGNENADAVSSLSGLERLLLFSSPDRWVPSEVRLKDDYVSSDDAPAGFYMIYSRAMEIKGNHKLAVMLKKRAFKKINKEKANYYSCSLFLLALY